MFDNAFEFGLDMFQDPFIAADRMISEVTSGFFGPSNFINDFFSEEEDEYQFIDYPHEP
jgi:hypothetical protein